MRISEQPDGPDGAEWRVPTDEVDATVTEAFSTYRVVGFYADPAKWEGYVAQWEARYGAKLKVKASRSNPIEWWMTGGTKGKITQALEQFHDAVIDGEMAHTGSVVLTQHILNARKRRNSTGYGIYKAYPESADKIDGAIATVLAWQARLDAIAAGAQPVKRKRRQPRRLY